MSATLASFFAMGDAAVFVWGAYGMAALLLGTELILLARQRRRSLQRLRQARRARAA